MNLQLGTQFKVKLDTNARDQVYCAFCVMSWLAAVQVKSSSKFHMAAAPAAFGAPAGARDREGAGRGAAQSAWLDSPESRGFIHIVLILIIAAPLKAPTSCFLFWKSIVHQCFIDPGRR